MTGNNVLPVTFRDPDTRAKEPYPSSAHSVMTAVNLFYFLEDISWQVTGGKERLFSRETLKAIRHGDFRVVHIQWCSYLRTNVSRFLQIVVGLFGPPAATKEGFSKLAEQLGLEFDYETDKRSSHVTAVLFVKRHGKNIVWSVGLYNKRRRIGQMRQGQTLDPDEEELIDNNVRFDMTAHGPGIMRIIDDAKRALKQFRKRFPKFLDRQIATEFLSQNPEQTARWLELAVHILSHRLIEGKIRRGSFADYLVPKFVKEVLRLNSIVCCTVEGLHAFEEIDDPIAKAWREVEKYDAFRWQSELCKKARCSKTTLYNRREEWLAKYQIDIAIPRAFYRDLRTYAPASLVLPEDRDALLAARDGNDGDETLRLLGDADRSFFQQMSEIVGAAVSSPPPLLRAKVEGEVKAIPGQPEQAVPADGIPARLPGSRQGALVRVPSRPLRSEARPGSSAIVTSGSSSPTESDAATTKLTGDLGASSAPPTANVGSEAVNIALRR